MIGAIAGDIIGSRFEGTEAPPLRFELFHSDCAFTDDTVCSLAVADALMTDRDFAGALQTFARRHPARGYGQMFEEWVSMDRPAPYGSWANGAPMRTAAVGWLARTKAEARRLAARQSRVTHNHPEAIAAAQAVSLAVFSLRNGETRQSVRAALEAEFSYELSKLPPRANGFDVSASGTAQSALAAALNSRGWVSAVRQAIACGGDTDTLASIAGAVAEAAHGVPRSIAKRSLTFLTEDLRQTVFAFQQRAGRWSLQGRAYEPTS